MSTIEDITDVEALNIKRKPREELAILDFYSDWCHPCKLIAPLLTEFSTKYNISKVNVDRCSEAVSSYGIRGIPTLVAVKNGKVLDTRVGNASKSELEEWLTSVDAK